MSPIDAVVVGAGPNGLAAAVVLARAGLSVTLIEMADEVGGGTRTTALTHPGFRHDVCSAVHPMAAGSPLFAALPLERYGLEWIQPPIALAHPFDDAPPALLHHDLKATAASLGDDRDAYRALLGPLVRGWPQLTNDVLAPLHVPHHPLRYSRFGLEAVRSMVHVARRHFSRDAARCLLGGIAMHSMQPLDHLGTAAPALILATLAHRVGWPIARGGSQSIADALAALFRGHGGQLELGHRVTSLSELPEARATLLDLTPRQVLAICGDALPHRYARALERYRYGPGVFKADWALSSPVPWKDAECARAGTVHLAGSFESLVAGERGVARGAHSEEPTVLLSQPSSFDPSRAPPGGHTLWAYCHVPNGSTVDMLPRVEAQIERFAPGFRDCIIARHTMNTAELERREPNAIGGDIAQGANTLRQLLFRPVVSTNPYATPVKGLYLCSSSTPPGPAVHGLCGYYAAKAALRTEFHLDVRRSTPLA